MPHLYKYSGQVGQRSKHPGLVEDAGEFGPEMSFPTGLFSGSIIYFYTLYGLDLCYTGTVAGGATDLSTGKAKVTAHIQICWEKPFPGSTFSHSGTQVGKGVTSPCDTEMVPPCHLPRDT